jgi:hypothetical protein
MSCDAELYHHPERDYERGREENHREEVRRVREQKMRIVRKALTRLGVECDREDAEAVVCALREAEVDRIIAKLRAWHAVYGAYVVEAITTWCGDLQDPDPAFALLWDRAEFVLGVDFALHEDLRTDLILESVEPFSFLMGVAVYGEDYCILDQARVTDVDLLTDAQRARLQELLELAQQRMQRRYADSRSEMTTATSTAGYA